MRGRQVFAVNRALTLPSPPGPQEAAKWERGERSSKKKRRKKEKARLGSGELVLWSALYSGGALSFGAARLTSLRFLGGAHHAFL